MGKKARKRKLPLPPRVNETGPHEGHKLQRRTLVVFGAIGGALLSLAGAAVSGLFTAERVADRQEQEAGRRIREELVSRMDGHRNSYVSELRHMYENRFKRAEVDSLLRNNPGFLQTTYEAQRLELSRQERDIDNARRSAQTALYEDMRLARILMGENPVLLALCTEAESGLADTIAYNMKAPDVDADALTQWRINGLMRTDGRVRSVSKKLRDVVDYIQQGLSAR